MFGDYRSFTKEGDGFRVSLALVRDTIKFDLLGASLLSAGDKVKIEDFVNTESGFIGCMASYIPDWECTSFLDKTVRFIEDNIDLVLDSTGDVRYASAPSGANVIIYE